MKRRLVLAACLALLGGGPAAAAPPTPYGPEAREVMQYVQKAFWNPETGLYARSLADRSPDYTWPHGVVFSALVAAARHEPRAYGPVMEKLFVAMDGYWDARARIPGYEPVPTRGGGNDKYYDDNAWMVITFLEAHQLTRDARYRARAEKTLEFVLSGWDAELGGGIWWHVGHKDGTKNACSNAPAAVGCLRLARIERRAEAKAHADWAQRIADWTRAHLQAADGLFEDRQVVSSGEVKRGKLTYNTALMIRALLGLHRQTGAAEPLKEAVRLGKAAEWFRDAKTGVYRDEVKWAHLQVEADLELYRTTKDDTLLDRAKRCADAYYAAWKKAPPTDMMANASIARVLWLLADAEVPAGQEFWKKADGPGS